jgi:hypothetical protein
MEVPEVIWDKIAVRCVVWVKVVARAPVRPGTFIVHTQTHHSPTHNSTIWRKAKFVCLFEIRQSGDTKKGRSGSR